MKETKLWLHTAYTYTYLHTVTSSLYSTLVVTGRAKIVHGTMCSQCVMVSQIKVDAFVTVKLYCTFFLGIVPVICSVTCEVSRTGGLT